MKRILFLIITTTLILSCNNDTHLRVNDTCVVENPQLGILREMSEVLTNSNNSSLAFDIASFMVEEASDYETISLSDLVCPKSKADDSLIHFETTIKKR